MMLILPFSAYGQKLPDLSGTWTVEQSRNETSQIVSRSDQRRGYTLVIVQTATELTLSLPRVPAETYQFNGSEKVFVHDYGDWWTKYRTLLKWDGSTLILKSVTLTGWWKDARPEDVSSQPTQLETTRTLKLSVNGEHMTMETLAVDEKPFNVKSKDLLAKTKP